MYQHPQQVNPNPASYYAQPQPAAPQQQQRPTPPPAPGQPGGPPLESNESYMAKVAAGVAAGGYTPSQVPIELQATTPETPAVATPQQPVTLPPSQQQSGPQPQSQAPTTGAGKLVCKRGDEYKPRPVEWLWPNRIPLATETIFVGDPDIGKSLTLHTTAARVSTGEPWPDLPDQRQQPGDVLILSAEENPDCEIIPRFLMAGGDTSRLHIIEAVDSGDGKEKHFSLARDLPAVEQKLRDLPDCRLLIIDPITAYCGGIDSHRTTDVRGLLGPLSLILQRHRVACIANTHMNKSESKKALYRATGSLAFVAHARAVWQFVEDPDYPGWKLMLCAKMNLAQRPAGLRYGIYPSLTDPAVPVIRWDHHPIYLTADDALAQAIEKSGSDGYDWQEATQWLSGVLAAGPQFGRDVKKAAREEGITEKTLRTAREKLGVVVDRGGQGLDHRAVWRLP